MPSENTGNKIYTILVQYNARTGLPTGAVKPNIPSDPDYVPPVVDLEMCPAILPSLFQLTLINNSTSDQGGLIWVAFILVNQPTPEDMPVVTPLGDPETVDIDGEMTFNPTLPPDSESQNLVFILGYERSGQAREGDIAAERRYGVSVFLFKDEELIEARTFRNEFSSFYVEGPPPDFEEVYSSADELGVSSFGIPNLSHEAVYKIIVVDSTYGYYNSANSVGVQASVDAGAFSFDINVTYSDFSPVKSVTIDTPNQFEDITTPANDQSFFPSDYNIEVTGNNNNDFDLQLEFLSSYVEWVEDPEGSDNWVPIYPENITEVIPPGPYTKVISGLLSPANSDYVIRIVKP